MLQLKQKLRNTRIKEMLSPAYCIKFKGNLMLSKIQSKTPLVPPYLPGLQSLATLEVARVSMMRPSR